MILPNDPRSCQRSHCPRSSPGNPEPRTSGFLAPDAVQALELVGNLGFSVALIDLDLPEGTGFDLIRTLRWTVPDLQIIAITNAIHSLSPEDAQKLGVVAVLKKPITADWKPVVERVRARRAGS